jgi:methyl-accepting chemotaxis protein
MNKEDYQLLQAIINNFAYIEFTPDSTILTANDLFCKAVEYQQSEIVGQKHRIFMPPEEVNSQDYKNFWIDLANGITQEKIFKRITKSGKSLFIKANYFAVKDENQQVVKIVKLATDFTQQMKIIEELGSATNDLTKSSYQLTSVANSLAAAAEETSVQSATASSASEEVNAGVQTVTSNMTQMVSAIKEITRTTNDASVTTQEAMRLTQETNKIIDKLGKSSIDIGSVIKVISSIAQQTNLLALNATIEAARAGDAGRGFAVVANEVKELSKQTSKATEDITKRIEAIQLDSKNAVTAVASISAAIDKVNGFASSIAVAVEEQAATTSEVNRVISESAEGVAQITKNIGEVTAAAEMTGKNASEANVEAKNLADLSKRLQHLVTLIK